MAVGGVLALVVYFLFVKPITCQPAGEDSNKDEDEKTEWETRDVYGAEAALRREIADLKFEVEWLRLDSKRPTWTENDALVRLLPLQREAAALRREAAWLRRDMLAGGGNWTGNPAQNFTAGLPPLADHGRTIVLTMCAGTVYFDAYCGPLLASFERAYGAAVTKHRVVVFTSSIEAPMLEAARNRFRPWADFVSLGRGDLAGEQEEKYNNTITGNSNDMHCWVVEGGKLQCTFTKEGVEMRKSKVEGNNYWFTTHVADYLRDNHEGFCHAVVIDSDTLFVRPLGKYLPECTSGEPAEDDDEWDVGVTVYDPDFVVPWADDPSEGGRTENGYSRLNAGVVLLRLHDAARVDFFLRRWGEATLWLTSGGEEAFGRTWHEQDRLQWQLWHDELLQEFRGPNQASLALLVSSYHTPRLSELLGWAEKCAACSQAVPARLDLFDGEEPALVRFRALPARELNHPESMPGGNFADELLIVHLKGLWWRMILPQGNFFSQDAHRRSTWNRDALLLHWLCYAAWQFDLPPEARPRTPTVVTDSEGNVVSDDELKQWYEDWTQELARQRAEAAAPS